VILRGSLCRYMLPDNYIHGSQALTGPIQRVFMLGVALICASQPCDTFAPFNRRSTSFYIPCVRRRDQTFGQRFY
jgi:hypothetical protein